MLTSCPRLTHFIIRVLNAHELVVGLNADKSRADEYLHNAKGHKEHVRIFEALEGCDR